MSQPEGDDGGRAPSPPPPRKVKKQVPQKNIDDFWAAFTTAFPGKVHTILPQNAYARSKAAREPKGPVYGRNTIRSYDEARDECVQTVAMIARECRRVNMRYRDPHFDIEFDLKSKKQDCLHGLIVYPDAGWPKSVKRVHQIFEDPHFYVDEATASDVRQGRAGDCWFLAALGALGNKKGLIDRVCVARDEKVGVYGFVFHRDGEWIHTVIDDKLYLSVPDYDESLYEKVNWLQIPNRQDAEEEYRKVYQTGSRALYFAQCNTENETWLPLLEKAFAKAHGDYQSIDGGFTGEAIEDLTGGVTTELFTSDILDVDVFWRDELSKVNDEFLFGCATGRFDDWQGGGYMTDRKGIQSGHAYSIMKAVEMKGERLLQVRNPWGETEWTGPWSDGSQQWNGEWLELLDHTFGDDGVFWISYKDLLRKYQFFDRTRLFGKEWKVTQQWTTVDVPWTAGYNDTQFSFTITKKTAIVIVLSQLDDRYWDGMQGQYSFSLHFRVSKDGDTGYIVRSHGNYSMTRSVSTELELEPGTYSVLMKITAKRYQGRWTVEDVVRDNCKTRQDKLLQVGLAYDLAHAKGLISETEDEKQRQAEQRQRDEESTKVKAREEAKRQKYNEWNLERKQVERARRERNRREEHKRKKAERKRAEAAETAKKGQPAEMVNDETKDPATAKEEPAAPDARPARKEVSVKSEEPASTANEAAAPPKPKAEETTPAAEIDPSTSSGSAKNTPASSRSAEDGADTTAPPAAAESSATKQTDEAVQTEPSVAEVDAGAKARIDAFNADPALAGVPPTSPARANAPPAIHVSDDEGRALPTPPPSPGQLHPPASPGAASDSDTIITWTSSIDSDLDARYFQAAAEAAGNDASDSQCGDGVDPDLEDYANDPWNAVCVVGLRLYTREGDVRLVAKKPSSEGAEAPLDLDDPSKGMSDEAASPLVGKAVQGIDEVLAGAGADAGVEPAKVPGSKEGEAKEGNEEPSVVKLEDVKVPEARNGA